jgi:hypothetical protein
VGTALIGSSATLAAGVLLVLPAVLARCSFLAPTRLGWFFYLPNVAKDLFRRRLQLSRSLGDMPLFLAGLLLLGFCGGTGSWIGLGAIAAVALLEVVERAKEREVLTVSWAFEDRRRLPPHGSGRDALPPGAAPHPSPHPDLTVNLVGPFAERRPVYSLGSLARGRIAQIDVLIGNHTVVPTQMAPSAKVEAGRGVAATLEAMSTPAPLKPGDIARWRVAVSSVDGRGGRTLLVITCGAWSSAVEIEVESAPRDAAIASASITRYPGACRAAFAWRGDMDHYDTSTFQSIAGLTHALGLAARYRIPQTMYLSTRLTLDADEAASFYGHFGVDRGAANIPAFIEWMNQNATLQHSATYPTDSSRSFLLELGNHMHLHYGTDASAAAGNNWQRQAGIGEGTYPWKQSGSGSFEEQRDNALEARRRIEGAFGFSPKSWAMPDSTKDPETARAVEAAGCEVTSDADGRQIHNVLFQPAPHLAAGSTAVELTKRYPGDPESLTAAEMIRFWVHRAWRRRIPVVFMCHQHMRLFAGEACARFTEYILRSVLTDFNGDVHVNTVFGIGDYWKNVLSPDHRTVAASLIGGEVRVVNSGGVARHSVPVDLVYRSGEKATVILDLLPGQEHTIAASGDMRA